MKYVKGVLKMQKKEFWKKFDKLTIIDIGGRI